MKSMNPNLVKEKIYRIPDLADIILTTERYKGKLYWHASLTDHTGEGPVPENFGIKLMETRIFEDWMKDTKMFIHHASDGRLHLSSYKIH
jgi:hypothetical protein